uniref:Uncharacterized protein n=1 Tax=Manihot esculenta TaxID=3983 RepID=A0A2C9W8V2_MANES
MVVKLFFVFFDFVQLVSYVPCMVHIVLTSFARYFCFVHYDVSLST